MNKKQFLSDLERRLRTLPKEEKDDILQDYQEYFSIGLEEGKTESQIAESLGSPKQLSKELLATYHIEKMETTTSTRNMFSAVWAVIGLGFVNLLIVLGPFLVILSLLLAGWITGGAGVLSPLLVVVNTVVQPDIFEWFDVFVSIAFCGVGLFILIGMYYASIGVKNVFLRYLKFNVSIVKGGVKHG
ncbi:HAAS signaling domain-containing protein [Ferdinandcohnia sp. Marseille-Q9671]